MVQYRYHRNSTVNGTLLHYYPIDFVVNSHVQDPGQFIINDNFEWLILL